MRWRGRSSFSLLAIILLIGTLAPLAVLQAQGSSDVTITLAVPPFQKEVFGEKLLAEFEASHPGVRVQVVTESGGIPQAAMDVGKHLEEAQKFAATADVLTVDSYHITPQTTRAGVYLDLAPLVNEDKNLNVDDFHPALWQAYQWDKGVWALPVATNVLVLTYLPAAFDKANVPYPDAGWTITDLDNAVRKLAVKDADGKVTVHGIDAFTGYSDVVLFRSLLGEGLYDASVIPNAPQLNKPGVEAILETWNKLDQDGLIGNDFNKAPIGIGSVFSVLFSTSPEDKRVGALLPGGKAGLDTQGFAVSAGTQYPDKAYALASWLTTRGEIAAYSAMTPARKSLAGIKSDDPRQNINMPAEVQKLIEQAIANGFSVSEMRYSDYAALALNRMKTEKLDAKSALDAAEAQAVKDMQIAADKKDKMVIAVATPIPQAETGGKAVMKFGLVVFASPLPQQDKWNKLVQEFVSADPQIGRIDLNTGFAQIDKLVEQNDCFYLPFNAVPNTNPNLLLNLDPFLSADSTFDKTDVLGNIMTQLQRDNKTWALPIDVEPAILKYDEERFNKAGAQLPVKGWTLDEFRDATKVLKVDPKDLPPFIAPNTGGVHLLILMAAYGGLPLDFRTDPPTINFSDPATVDAIRQVLDLAKNGYLKYDALGNLVAGFGGGGRLDAPIYADNLSLFTIRPPDPNQGADPYKVTTYPKGSKFAGISYGIGTAYISARSSNPEGCYRWISTVAKHPELFSAMPARRSQLNDPALVQSQGQDVIALYSQIDALLQDPNTISFPSQFSGGASPTGFLLQHWLYEAFDNYVLKDGDLDSALKDAETIAKGFQDCAVKLPPLDASNAQQSMEYIKQFGDCAVKVDPKLKSLFDLIK
jgi:ABC-type glycerol-3-phosphate transport system substrate-binding protein